MPAQVVPPPLLISINEACRMSRLGRSFLYERLADGSIKSRKAGRRRLVDVASLQAWAASLPSDGLAVPVERRKQC